MKRLLLVLVCVLFAMGTYAQTPAPITGGSSICIGSSWTLSDATPGGTWSSSNPGVVAIGSTTGVITGISAGTAVITYSILTGYVTEIVGSHPNPASFVTPASVCIGGTSTVTLTDATSGGLWSSSNPFVVSVGSTSGVITGVSVGSVTISYTLSTGCYAVNTVSANSLAISGAAVLCVGGSPLTLTDATSGGTWTSSNPAVATVGVSSGIVSPVALGTTNITYSAGPGCAATTSISVKGVPTVSPSSIEGCVGSTYQLTASPPGGGWGTTTPGVANVNFLGVVSGVSAGTGSITYTAAGGCSTVVPVTINPVPAPITGTNYAYTGTTTTLSDITPLGTWSSSNLALATVNPASGVVTGISSGLLYISYTLSTGCLSYYRIEINPMPATSNLYAWYPFCMDSSDHSGNGRDLINHGLVTSPATLTADRFGNPNNAYYFNGINSMMNYTTFFPNSGTPPDFTYSCWMRATGPQSAIILYNGNPGADGFGFVINNGTMGVAGTQVGVLFGGTGGLYASTNITVGPGAWHNLVLVKNGGVYNFYVDNAPGTFFIETNTPLFSDVFALGLNFHSTLPGQGPIREAFDGDIDDIAVINRQLTAPERLSLYNYNPDATLFSLGNDTTICTDQITLAPVPQTIGAIYTWSQFMGFSGYSVIDTTHSALTVYPAVGPFGNTYTLTISKPYGCSAFDTIVVYKAPIPVNLGPDQNLCLGDTITLTNSFPSASFLWNTGDTTHSIKVATSGTYYVTVDSIFVNILGDTAICVGRDTAVINFHPVPFVSMPAAATNCVGGSVTLYSYFDTAYNYLWSTGQTVDTIVVSTTGSYWVRVNDHGCVRYDTGTVNIVYDTVSFYNFTDTAVCGLYMITNRKASVNPIVNYQWTPTSGIPSSNVANPSITADTSAEYYLTVSYPGCPDIVDSFHIDVQPTPSVSMGGNYNVCYGDTIHIQAMVTPAWYSQYIYSWSPTAGLDDPTKGTVVYLSGEVTQDTTIKYFITVTTPAWRPGVNTCASEDSGFVFVHPRHFAKLDTAIGLCPGDSVQLIPNDTSSLGSIIASAQWSPGMYLSDSTSITPWVHPITDETYRLIAFSQFGCRDTMSADISVHPGAVLNLGDSAIIYPGDSYQISPQTNCVFFEWSPPLGMDNPNVSNPIVDPGVNTTYFVTATTEFGCAIYDSFRVHVNPANIIAMPNAFSPDAGINSKFSVLTQGIVSLNYFHIFNRWGVMVYDSKNINDGWDGTYKGQPQPFGVYVYELEAVTVEGKVFKRTGNVTLLR